MKYLPLVVLLLSLSSCIEEEKTRSYAEFNEDYEAIQNGTFTGFGFDAGPLPDTGRTADTGSPGPDPDMSTMPAQCSVAGTVANVTFVNNTGQDAVLTWIDYECNPQNYGAFAAGQTAAQSTFVGHVWQLVAGGQVLAERVVQTNGETITFE